MPLNLRKFADIGGVSFATNGALVRYDVTVVALRKLSRGGIKWSEVDKIRLIAAKLRQTRHRESSWA